MKADIDVLGVVLVFALAALLAMPMDRTRSVGHQAHARSLIMTAAQRPGLHQLQK